MVALASVTLCCTSSVSQISAPVSTPNSRALSLQPPVATLVYNGTEPAGKNWPIATYRWVGTQNQRDDFVYHTTANAAETPVGFFDFYRGEKTWFQTITIIQPTQWPAGTWTPPKNC
jgi:hypothetical protein